MGGFRGDNRLGGLVRTRGGGVFFFFFFFFLGRERQNKPPPKKSKFLFVHPGPWVFIFWRNRAFAFGHGKQKTVPHQVLAPAAAFEFPPILFEPGGFSKKNRGGIIVKGSNSRRGKTH